MAAVHHILDCPADSQHPAGPAIRFTSAGQPVARFRVASTPRFRDNASGEWKDGDSLFLTCNVWRQAAENVAESLTRACG